MSQQTVIRVGILGASGYGGAELIRRLLQHPHADIVALGSRQYEGQAIGACWPQLAGLLPDLRFSDNDTVINTADVIFCATPHGATAPLVHQALTAGKRVLDLSADYRLNPDDYHTWYNNKHPHPEHFNVARYGLVELHRQELSGSQLIAVPGCNSSTAILALAPLAAHGLLGEDVIANIATGISGAGRAVAPALHFTEASDSVVPYKVAGQHRHTAEIEMTLGRLRTQGKALSSRSVTDKVPVSFNPHRVPMSRGILATCYTRPEQNNITTDTLLTLYNDFYQDDPLIHVQDALPETKAVYGSDRAIISVRKDDRTGHIIAFAAIDNLGKGAAGQAVQNFNVMHDFEETSGLNLGGVWP